MRFLASGLIVLYHYGSEGPAPLERFSPIFLRGYLATDFFLMLSAYVLARAYGAQIARGAISDEAFLLRRITRVWPGHLIVLSTLALIVVAATAVGLFPHHVERYDWRALPAQALLIHAWGPFDGHGWNMPSWSLSALIVCYAAFPTLWRTLRRLPTGPMAILAGLAIVAVADGVSHLAWSRPLYDLPFERGVVRALPLFVLGACLARAGEDGWMARMKPAWAAAACGLGVIALQIAGRFDFVSIVLLAMLIAAAGEVALKRGGRLVAAAAQLSFALYITHIVTALVWFDSARLLQQRFAVGPAGQWALWVCAFPAALGAAWLFDRLLDQPVQALVARGLRWRRGQRPASAQSASAPPR